MKIGDSKEKNSGDKKNSESTYVLMLKELCAEESISLDSFSGDWLFRLSKNGLTRHIIGYQFELNSQAAGALCKDKCATSDILEFNGVPCVKHHYFISPANLKYIGGGNWERLSALLKRYGRLVCKPNEGTGGSNVYVAEDQSELENAAEKIFTSSNAMAVCEYREILNEYRAVILNGNVELIFSKRIPHVVGNGQYSLIELIFRYVKENKISGLKLDVKESLNRVLPKGEVYRFNWRHNLGQGAEPIVETDTEIYMRLQKLALSAAEALNIVFASIDIILTENGYYVLEVNSGVMMEHFASHSDLCYTTAKNIYKKAVLSMF